MNVINADIYEMLGPHKLHLRQEAIDIDALGPTEVVGRTIVSVISPGTEIAAYTGAPPLRPMNVYPRVNGYCNVAEVVAVGQNVTDIQAGDRISTHQSHRSAFKCDQSAVNAVLEPNDDPIEQATLYLWHLGYYPLLRAKAVAGTNVAVIGLGTLGLTAVAAACVAGCNVIALSHRTEAQEMACKFGAKATFGLTHVEDVKNWAKAEFEPTGVDLVISTSNNWHDWKVALEIARNGGTISVVGFPGRGLPLPDFNPLDSQYIYDKELSIIGCGTPPSCNVSARDVRFTRLRNYKYIGKLIRERRLPALDIVNDTVDWKELDALYQRMANREPNLLTAALQWQ
ncbi:zinc-binding dehydrogenase [Pseudomonadota bacterium]